MVSQAAFCNLVGFFQVFPRRAGIERAGCVWFSSMRVVPVDVRISMTAVDSSDLAPFATDGIERFLSGDKVCQRAIGFVTPVSHHQALSAGRIQNSLCRNLPGLRPIWLKVWRITVA